VGFRLGSAVDAGSIGGATDPSWSFSKGIDAGMRKGLPTQDWASVVTVYDDAQPVARFMGNENRNNARVVLLDGQPTVSSAQSGAGI